ncbi:hypothetical protein LEP1GSC080_0794 [Leptospira interrogans str. FPW2026]|nr:hypothetical protein LEP1GSC080_0794 [Leptospira interrogans str. FPW2026]
MQPDVLQQFFRVEFFDKSGWDFTPTAIKDGINVESVFFENFNLVANETAADAIAFFKISHSSDPEFFSFLSIC